MFIVTARLSRRRLALGVSLAALICCCLVGFGLAAQTRPALAPAGPAQGSRLRTNEDRVRYLSSFGWEVEPQPLSVQELLIPTELDETYRNYLELQESQGFDLAAHAGRRVRRYSYAITNYPTGETGVQANLLVRRGKAVGGEVLSPRLDGFHHGLAMPEGLAADP